MLDGKGQGDRVYAMKRFKTVDESAQQIIKSLTERVEVVSRISGDLVLKYDRVTRHRLDELKRVDMSGCVIVGANLLKLEVSEHAGDGHVLFDVANPIPVDGKFKSKDPKVVGSNKTH